MRWLIGLLLACSILWLGRYQIRHLLFGVKPPSKDSPAGEWVGQIDINGGYVPAKMGDTPGPHKKAAIYFKLSVEDGFMDEYVGPGEFYIQGETTPRTIRIVHFRMHDNGSAVSLYMLTKPILVGRFHGQYTPSEIKFSQQDPWDLMLRARCIAELRQTIKPRSENENPFRVNASSLRSGMRNVELTS
jgi:hypothetical protein